MTIKDITYIIFGSLKYNWIYFFLFFFGETSLLTLLMIGTIILALGSRKLQGYISILLGYSRETIGEIIDAKVKKNRIFSYTSYREWGEESYTNSKTIWAKVLVKYNDFKKEYVKTLDIPYVDKNIKDIKKELKGKKVKVIYSKIQSEIALFPKFNKNYKIIYFLGVIITIFSVISSNYLLYIAWHREKSDEAVIYRFALSFILSIIFLNYFRELRELNKQHYTLTEIFLVFLLLLLAIFCIIIAIGSPMYMVTASFLGIATTILLSRIYKNN